VFEGSRKKPAFANQHALLNRLIQAQGIAACCTSRRQPKRKQFSARVYASRNVHSGSFRVNFSKADLENAAPVDRATSGNFILPSALKSSGTSPNLLITWASLNRSRITQCGWTRSHGQRISGTSLTSPNFVMSASLGTTGLRRVLCHLGFYRTVAARAVKIAVFLGLDKPKAFGNTLDLYNPRELILRRKHGDAVLAATTAHKILDPMFAVHR
jgi:hypothetical protein